MSSGFDGVKIKLSIIINLCILFDVVFIDETWLMLRAINAFDETKTASRHFLSIEVIGKLKMLLWKLLID